MDLDERPLDGEQRVAQRDARVGQAAGVDDRDVEVAEVQPIDQRALVVRLEEGDREAELRGLRRDPGMDLVERLVAVDLGLAGADQVEVRALQHEHGRHRGLPLGVASRPAAARSTSAGSMSSRMTTPSAVGRTQRRRPAACFLSVARWSRTVASG